MVQPFQNTLKEHKRYLVYEPADDDAVKNAFLELFGTQGAAQAGIQSVQKAGMRSILRVNRSSVDQLKAALVHAGKNSLITSGTLKNARAALEQ